MTASEDRDYNLVEGAFQDLLNSIEYKTEKADNQLITRAFQLAKDAHIKVSIENLANHTSHTQFQWHRSLLRK